MTPQRLPLIAPIVLIAPLLLAACQRPADDGATAPAADEAAPAAPAAPVAAEPPPPPPAPAEGATTEFLWPDSLRPLGAGYPAAGDPCRRVGESPATAELLDDSADLVGCPGARDDVAVRALLAAGGRVVGEVDGVTLVSVPRGRPASGD